MKFLAYSIISSSVLFLSYRISLVRMFSLCSVISVLLLIKGIKGFAFETIVFVVFINTIPIITEGFKKGFSIYKDNMRAGFEGTRKTYLKLIDEDKYQIESNSEKEKKLHKILSLYEISRDMSNCLSFEDIFNIFSSTLKKSFRFRISKLVLLNQPKEIAGIYQIELGNRVTSSAFDDFDKELVDIAFENRKMISISCEEPSPYLRRLSIIKDFETLISVPLFAESEIAGLLYIENMPKIYFESFIILENQFAIQFQKVMLYKKVQEMSITDSLTGVSTRRYFIERFSEEIRRSMNHKVNLSFLMLDIDRFKEKNDRFGHLVGDVILKESAAILKCNLREIDVIGRYGGEEFGIVLAGIERDGAFQVSERIRENIEKTIFKAYDEVVSTTVSIGISVFPDDGVDINSLIDSADKALYKAKETGRNRVC